MSFRELQGKYDFRRSNISNMPSDATIVSKSKKGKPARLQVDPETITDDDKPPQTGNVFNIWFLKWSGGDSSTKNYTKLKFRVNIKKDSGYTRAPSNAPLCLFFARGCCYLGKKCSYYHRLPSDTDYFIPTQDCFGRDKTSDYKDDMNGVGSFTKVNRTIYIGGLHMDDKMDNTLTKHFQEFGSIDKIRVLHSKACAFVTFRTENEAQFAKEAMQNQSLDGNEVLNIRWANEDPNPEAQRQEKRRLEEVTVNTIKNLLDLVSETERKTKKVTVEGPDEIEETESSSEVKALPSLETSSSLFNESSLNALKQMQSKKRKIDKQPEKKFPTMLGYSSSDEE